MGTSEGQCVLDALETKPESPDWDSLTYTEEIYGWIARVHEVSQESMKGKDLQ